MTEAIKKPTMISSVLLVISLVAFFSPLLVLTIIYPEAMENTLSDPSIPLFGVLVGFLGMLFAKSNLSSTRLAELVKPPRLRTAQMDEKMSWEAKGIFGISVAIFLMSLIMSGTSIASIIN